MERESQLKMGECLKPADHEMCLRRTERDQALIEKQELKEAIREVEHYNYCGDCRGKLIHLPSRTLFFLGYSSHSQPPTWVHPASDPNPNDPPYEMSYGWNSNAKERQPSSENDQAEGNVARIGPTTNLTSGESPQTEEKWHFLEERLQAIEGVDRYNLDVADLCLVPGVALLIDFKTPVFDKYKGSSCSKTHLVMYYRKIASYIHDDKLLIHYFQNSLSGATLGWYVGLERGRVRSWKDLAKAFLKQYKYNENMAPDRTRLQNMTKKDHEGFKEYTQRWLELATQVQTPLAEKEMVTMFIDTLPSPFYDKVVGNVFSNFFDLVVVSERIETEIKRGKFAHVGSNVGFVKKPNLKKKTGKANTIGLKHKVQDLIEGKWLSFKENGPNVSNNPLLTHRGPSINALSHEYCEGESAVDKNAILAGARREEVDEENKEAKGRSSYSDSAHSVEEGSHQIQKEMAKSSEVAMIEGNGQFTPKPLTVHYNPTPQTWAPLIIQVSAPPTYQINHIVL
ncbi:hypothetical protein CR513_08021, partial [Mucuna pruriens]